MDFLVSALQFIGILLLVLMVFNIMIIVHEWGHFLAGRWRGLYIDRFQIWFGNPIWKKTYNGVQYGLGWIPAGGFVSLPQMAPMESIEGKVENEDGSPKELPPITPLDKIIVAAAGPLFSFLLAVVFAVIVWAVKKPVTEGAAGTTVGIVAQGSAAEEAGIQPGDEIIRVDGKEVERFSGMHKSIIWTVISSENQNIEVDLIRPGQGEMSVTVERPAEAEKKEVEGSAFRKAWAKISERPPLRGIGIRPQLTPLVADFMEESPHSPAELAGIRKGDIIVGVNDQEIKWQREISAFKWEADTEYDIRVSRGGKVLDLKITPRVPEKDGEKVMLGVVWNQEGVRTLVRENPITQVVNSFSSIVNTLRAVFSPKSDVKAGHLSGPVGIMGLYYDLFQSPEGWRLALWFSVLLNVNLAILNMLPFPVLDGGHIVMSVAEWIRRKPLPIKFLEVTQMAFVLLLLGFMAFVTLKDVGDRVPKGADPNAKPIPKFLPLKEKSA